jgi:hypothetical protein
MDPDNDGDAMGGDRDNDGDGGGRMWGSAQPRMMPWDRQAGGMQWGQPQGAPNGNTGVVGPGQGRPQMPWGGGFQPGGIMGGQGQQGGMPNWQALAQQFAQRFAQNNPFLQRLGMTGQGQMPPGQAPAGPPQGQPGGTPPIWAGPQAAQGQPQPGAAPQGGAFAPQIQRLAAMFGRQQPGGIVGPGQGPQNY